MYRIYPFFFRVCVSVFDYDNQILLPLENILPSEGVVIAIFAIVIPSKCVSSYA